MRKVDRQQKKQEMQTERMRALITDGLSRDKVGEGRVSGEV